MAGHSLTRHRIGEANMWGKNHELKKLLGDKSTSATYDRSTDSLEAIRDALTASRYSTGTVIGINTDGANDIITLTTSASANTFGNWAQCIASVAQDSYLNCGIVYTSANSEIQVFEIGVGANPSEAMIYRITAYGGAAISGHAFTCNTPIKIASGARISARASTNSANARTVYISFNLQIGL